MVSLPVFGGIAYIMLAEKPAKTDDQLMAGLIFSGLALALVVVGLVVRTVKAGTHALPLLMERQDSSWQDGLTAEQIDQIKQEAMLAYKTATIMGTACAEAAALCGLALALLTNMAVLYLPFGGAAAAVILWQVPNQASLDAISRALVKKKTIQQ